MTDPACHPPRDLELEWGAALPLLPVAATLVYYVLPTSLQVQSSIQFAPQLIAYGAVGIWAFRNAAVLPRLGLTRKGFGSGVRWGLLTGVVLGSLNSCFILAVVPRLGYDIAFLKDTPHGRMPALVMVPWFICAIAVLVELNFRGFLLGRLAAMEARHWNITVLQRMAPLALLTSIFTFAFDPFMVNTFKHLHWIAVWDGAVWGVIWLRTRNLFVTMVAHAIEVMLLYLAVRMALG